MSFAESSPKAIAEVIGERIKQARLNENLSQEELAKMAGISRTAINYVEMGKTKLETFIAVLIALKMVEHLDLFMPVQTISPLQFAKLKGKQRKRASTKSSQNNAPEKSQNEDLAW